MGHGEAQEGEEAGWWYLEKGGNVKVEEELEEREGAQ